MEDHVLEFACIGVENGGTFPAEHTGRGSDVSPEFVIKNLSPNAQTIAITLEDLTHPIKNFTHWIIWNIPAADRIRAQIPPGANVPGMSGMNCYRISALVRFHTFCFPARWLHLQFQRPG